MAITIIAAAPEFVKSIAYDRDSREYVAKLDGEVKGYFKSYFDAEQALDALVYELLAERAAVAVADSEAECNEATSVEGEVIVMGAPLVQASVVPSYEAANLHYLSYLQLYHTPRTVNDASIESWAIASQLAVDLGYSMGHQDDLCDLARNIYLLSPADARALANEMYALLRRHPAVAPHLQQRRKVKQLVAA